MANKKKHKCMEKGGDILGQFGQGLSTLSGLASMIPGVGTAVGMGMNLVGGMMSKEAEAQALFEAQQKELGPKTNTPTGTLGLPNYKFGGKMNYKNGGGILKEFQGPSHAQGGIPVSRNGQPTHRDVAIAEVEGGETLKDNYVFSDKLVNPTSGKTFADESKVISKRYAPKGLDTLRDKTKELEFEQLKAKNDETRTIVESFQQSTMPQMATGGNLPTEAVPTLGKNVQRLVDNQQRDIDRKAYTHTVRKEFKGGTPQETFEQARRDEYLIKLMGLTDEQYMNKETPMDDKQREKAAKFNYAKDDRYDNLANQRRDEILDFKGAAYPKPATDGETIVNRYEMAKNHPLLQDKNPETYAMPTDDRRKSENLLASQRLDEHIYNQQKSAFGNQTYDEFWNQKGKDAISTVTDNLTNATEMKNKKKNGGYIPKMENGGDPLRSNRLQPVSVYGLGQGQQTILNPGEALGGAEYLNGKLMPIINQMASVNPDEEMSFAPKATWNQNSPQAGINTSIVTPEKQLSNTTLKPITLASTLAGLTKDPAKDATANTMVGKELGDKSGINDVSGQAKSTNGNGKIPLTVGDKIQMASNFTSPLFNLVSAAQGYDKEPIVNNKYAKEALDRMGNLRIRPDFNPIYGQANATREGINAGSSGMQRLAGLLGVNNQVGDTLASAATQVANQNVALDQAFSQAQLGQGERDRAEAVRAKGTTDANQAARFNMLSKAFEQLGTATGTVGSGLNSREESMTNYNMMKNIFPDLTLVEYKDFMASRGEQNYKYSGGVKNYAPANAPK